MKCSVRGDITGQTFTITPAIYHRNGSAYESVLQSGLEAFGSTDSEKRMDRYVLGLASDSPNTTDSGWLPFRGQSRKRHRGALDDHRLAAGAQPGARSSCSPTTWGTS